MGNWTRREFSIAVLAGSSGRVFAWDAAAEAILAVSEKAFGALKSYLFEGRSVSESVMAGKTRRSEVEFTVAFEAPDKFRIEYRYPTAGKWLRVCDGRFVAESRTLTKEFTRAPADSRSLLALRSSPIARFARPLEYYGSGAVFARQEMVEIDKRPVNCDVIEFAPRREDLHLGEAPGPSRVWIHRENRLVMREELQTHRGGNEGEATISITSIERFRVNETDTAALFAIQKERR